MRFSVPLRLAPHFSERPWGGSKLRSELHKAVPEGRIIGESWEISDHPDGVSRIASGDAVVTGRSFGDVVREHPREMIGHDVAPARYPLLVKYIDAADDLSIQVHPGDEWCRAQRREDRGKSECWYVIHAEPTTTIIAGYKRGVLEADAHRAIAEGRLRTVLEEWPLEAGDFIPIPPGAVHAMMAGTLVCEIQQSSNLTFRLHDWNRKPARPLHIKESMHVTDWDANVRAGVRKFGAMNSGEPSFTFENEFFAVTCYDVKARAEARLPLTHETGAIVNVVGGAGVMRGHDWEERLAVGDTFYLPAAMTSEPMLRADAHGLRILRTISREL